MQECGDPGTGGRFFVEKERGMNAIRPEQLRLYAVTDRSWLRPGESLETVVETILQNGVTCLQLREKHCTHEEMVCYARCLRPICAKNGVPLILNDDVQAAVEAGADGVHVGQKDMSLREARTLLGPGKIIGTSAHTVEEALAAEAAGADYLGCGAVFGSTTKTDAGRLVLAELQKICRAVRIPVVAIGGISRDNLPQLAGCGVDGVAVISALFAAVDKARATREMRALADQVARK